MANLYRPFWILNHFMLSMILLIKDSGSTGLGYLSRITCCKLEKLQMRAQFLNGFTMCVASVCMETTEVLDSEIPFTFHAAPKCLCKVFTGSLEMCMGLRALETSILNSRKQIYFSCLLELELT